MFHLLVYATFTWCQCSLLNRILCTKGKERQVEDVSQQLYIIFYCRRIVVERGGASAAAAAEPQLGAGDAPQPPARGRECGSRRQARHAAAGCAAARAAAAAAAARPAAPRPAAAAAPRATGTRSAAASTR